MPSRSVSPLVAAVAILCGLVFAGAASAATLTVTQTADTSGGTCTPSSCSLRQAIAAVADGDVIVLPADATPYGLTFGQLVLAEGVTIKGAGAQQSVIEAQDADRVMLIAGNASPVRLEGLTITGGDTTRAGGGGIAAAGPGPLVLSRVTVRDNHVHPSAPGFGQGGGGVFSIPSLTLDHSTVSGNTVTVTQSTGDGGGGGIFMQTGDLTILDSTVSQNTATVTPVPNEFTDNNGGGGIYVDGHNLTIVRSLIEGNTAAVDTATPSLTTPADGGGGIYQFGNHLLLRDSAVIGNVAHGPGVAKSGGGGIFDDGDTSQYLNSTIADNSTDMLAATTSFLPDSNGGGGVLFDAVKGGVTMANMTITGNSAPAAAGGAIGNQLDTSVQITNSIIAGNTDAAGADCSGPMRSQGFNLTDDGALSDSCSLTATGDLLGLPAGLGDLGDHGGPTPTQALLAGSPAIDAGDPAGCTDLLGNPLSADQRGTVRPQPADGRCDIGAYELVTPAAPPVDGPRPVPAPAPAPPAQGARPAVVTLAATRVGPTSATLNATVDAKGQATTFRFAYGSSPVYGTTTASASAGAGSGPVAHAVVLRGIKPGRLYHFRVTARNASGALGGQDLTFRTAARPAPRSLSASATPRVDRTAPFRFTIAGHLALPAGMVRAVGCRGTVSVKATLAGRSVGTAAAKVGGGCRYTVKLTVRRAGRIRLVTRFGGTTVLAPRSAAVRTVTAG